MQNVDAEAAAGHVPGEGGLLIQPPLPRTQHPKAGKPGIKVGKGGFQIAESCVILPPEVYRVDDGQHTAHGQQTGRPFGEQGLDLFMGEQNVARKEAEQVKSVAVDLDHRGVQNIGAAPQAEHQKADHWEIRLAAQLPQPVVFVQLPDQHQHHLAQQQLMQEPQHPDAGQTPDEVFGNQRNLSAIVAENIRVLVGDPAGTPSNEENNGDGGNELAANLAFQVLLARLFFQTVPGADAGDHEKRRHEPGVQHIQRRVQRRNAGDDHVCDDPDAVELIKYVICHNGQHDAVAQIVQKWFSHDFPPRRWRLIRLVLYRMESRMIPQIRA